MKSSCCIPISSPTRYLQSCYNPKAAWLLAGAIIACTFSTPSGANAQAPLPGTAPRPAATPSNKPRSQVTPKPTPKATPQAPVVSGQNDDAPYLSNNDGASPKATRSSTGSDRPNAAPLPSSSASRAASPSLPDLPVRSNDTQPVSVAGIIVTGLRDEAAIAKLRLDLAQTLGEPVVLTDGLDTWTFTRAQLGARIPLEAMLREAQETGRDVPLRFVIDVKTARAALTRLSKSVNRIADPRRDGVLPVDTDAPRRPQRVTMAVEGSIARLRKALENTSPEESVELVVKMADYVLSAPIPQPVPAATPALPAPESVPAPVPAPSRPVATPDRPFLKKTPYLLASFSTPYDPKILGRTQNLRLAARNVNGTVIAPGKVFSTNLAIGRRNAGDGWQEAKMFEGGRVTTGIGAGICQCATTLYNAALLAGLPIVERHPHTFRVSYAPASRDATIYWGSKDMRFRNDTGGPIYVRTYLRNRKFHVELYGVKPVTAEIEVASRILSREKGTRSEAFRTIRWAPGKEKTVRLSRDFYRPHP